LQGHSPIVLGIDPGTHTTGYGVATQIGTRLVCLKKGAIRTSDKQPLEQRLRTIYNQLVAVIDETSPDVMAVEAIFYAKNVRSAVILAHARGVALLAAANKSLPVIEYSATEVKQSTVGYGRASKEQILTMVSRLFRLPTAPTTRHDSTDALAVALCHLNVGNSARRIAQALNLETPTRRLGRGGSRWRTL